MIDSIYYYYIHTRIYVHIYIYIYVTLLLLLYIWSLKQAHTYTYAHVFVYKCELTGVHVRMRTCVPMYYTADTPRLAHQRQEHHASYY